MKKWNSLLQDSPECCFLCGSRILLEKHHIFGGANRKLSESDGLYVMLCRPCHTGDHGVHFDKDIMQYLHEKGEMAYLKDHTLEDFRRRYGKNYL